MLTLICIFIFILEHFAGADLLPDTLEMVHHLFTTQINYYQLILVSGVTDVDCSKFNFKYVTQFIIFQKISLLLSMWHILCRRHSQP